MRCVSAQHLLAEASGGSETAAGRWRGSTVGQSARSSGFCEAVKTYGRGHFDSEWVKLVVVAAVSAGSVQSSLQYLSSNYRAGPAPPLLQLVFDGPGNKSGSTDPQDGDRCKTEVPVTRRLTSAVELTLAFWLLRHGLSETAHQAAGTKLAMGSASDMSEGTWPQHTGIRHQIQWCVDDPSLPVRRPLA